MLELGQRRAMEGAGGHPVDTERPQSAPQLTGGLAGEGERHDTTRRIGAGVDAVRDPPGDHPGLTGTSSGEHAYRPPQRRHRLALLLV